MINARILIEKSTKEPHRIIKVQAADHAWYIHSFILVFRDIQADRKVTRMVGFELRVLSICVLKLYDMDKVIPCRREQTTHAYMHELSILTNKSRKFS